MDWCFLTVVSYQKAVKEMAAMYIDGDTEYNCKKHHIPTFRDPRFMKRGDGMSKVITRISTKEPPFLFFF